MAGLPSGTVTFLFTDIEGSTRLWDAHHAAMAVAVADHDALLRQSITEHSGFVFKTVGDAFCAAFPSSSDALGAALAAQGVLASRTFPEVGALRVRMGLHAGEAEERDNDYFGPAVNRVARLMSAGHGGQVLVSEATRNLLADDADGRTLKELGSYRLAGLPRPERIFQLVADDLDDHFPPLRTAAHGQNSAFSGEER